MKETLGSSAPVGPLDGAWPVCGHLWWETWHEVRLNIRLKKKWEQGPCVVNKFNVSLEKKKSLESGRWKTRKHPKQSAAFTKFPNYKRWAGAQPNAPPPMSPQRRAAAPSPTSPHMYQKKQSCIKRGDLLPLGRLTADSHFIQVFWGPFVQKE